MSMDAWLVFIFVTRGHVLCSNGPASNVLTKMVSHEKENEKNVRQLSSDVHQFRNVL